MSPRCRKGFALLLIPMGHGWFLGSPTGSRQRCGGVVYIASTAGEKIITCVERMSVVSSVRTSHAQGSNLRSPCKMSAVSFALYSTSFTILYPGSNRSVESLQASQTA